MTQNGNKLLAGGFPFKFDRRQLEAALKASRDALSVTTEPGYSVPAKTDRCLA
jgi:hypothetical protein